MYNVMVNTKLRQNHLSELNIVPYKTELDKPLGAKVRLRER